MIIYITGSALRQLSKEVTKSKRMAFAPGTRQNYLTQIFSFYAFCRFFCMPWLSVDGSILALYAQFLSRTFRSPESVRNYIHSVKKLYLILELPTKIFDDLDLKLTLRGISRLKKHVPKRAEPITPSILLEIHSLLDMSDQFHVVCWALFVIAFFSMSRKSNLVFTPGKYSTNHMILRKHITVLEDCLILKFYSSKTIQFGKKVHTVPLVAIPGSPLCPLNSYISMCNVVKIPDSAPAFCISHKQGFAPLTYSNFQGFLRTVLSLLGYSSSKFSSHSFRRGGATWAFKNYVPGELIKDHGGWASDAYLLYLDLSFDNKLNVSKSMTSSLVNFH